MIAFVQGALLALTAMCLGLRTTSVLKDHVHPAARAALAAVAGSIFVFTGMQIAMRNNAHDLGLGLLLSLSPAGVFDLMKWWYRWGK